MKKTIEKNVVSISIWTSLTVILAVVSMVWNIAWIRTEFQKVNWEFNTRITIIEKAHKTQQDYLQNLKADLKEDIEKNNKKLEDIYKLLLKK
jgi:hypothetical protein